MYEIFNMISQVFYEPLLKLTYGTQSIPLLSAFILGILGSLAPCQFTGNLAAMMYYGNRSVQKGIIWAETLFYLLGKIVVFSGFGLIVFLLGSEIQREFTLYFPWVRKVLGPVLIIMGLYLVGVIKMNWTLSFVKSPKKAEGKFGAFLLGSSFSLGFCPTMFSLFFISLMPLALSSQYGAIMPSMFAIGTALPFLIVIFLIWYYGFNAALMKKGRKVGFWVQRTIGVFMILIGILDTITYWTF
ncbi:sulfite exporter TauE/SafE family protein [Anaerobacillus sp. MEB173]|uniref:urease accessory protein UreH domain-containing protein n=1 Tax=Anaerobacillus sp. MEB173 TaxID=3383345 RepID=UPI003F8E6C85